MAAAPNRIALQRRTVPHSYNRDRRLQIGSTSGTDYRSANTDNHASQLSNNSQQATTTNRALAQNTSSSVPSQVFLTGFDGAVYVADVRVGTRWFNLIVDTGSTDTWISCYVYDATRCLDECPGAATNITYGSGDVCVTTEYLTVKLGKIQKQNYAVGIALNPIVKPGTEASGGILLGQSHGILGLGYPALRSFESPVGFWINYVNSFSVFFAPQDDPDGSFLILDGVDDEFISKNGLVPYHLPLKNAQRLSHWTLGLTGFQVEGFNETIAPCAPLENGSCDAIIDTGTTMLVAPPQVFRTIVSKILVPTGCYENQPGEGIYVCGRTVKLPTLRLTFGKMNFYLEMEDYIQRKPNGLVVVEIQPGGSLGSLSQSWVVGGTFLKKFYSSYEVSRAVVFYCIEGTTCDQNGTAAVALPGESVLTSTGNDSAANEASTTTDVMPGGLVGGTSVGNTTDTATLPSDTSSNSSTIVSTTKSGGGNSHALTITIVASLAGVAFVVLVVFIVRKLYRKRQHRQEESLVGLEMETLASSGGGESAYVSGAALTQTATK